MAKGALAGPDYAAEEEGAAPVAAAEKIYLYSPVMHEPRTFSLAPFYPPPALGSPFLVRPCRLFPPFFFPSLRALLP